MTEHNHYGPEDFLKLTTVSRETLDQLCVYDAIFLEWSKKINLVSKSSLPSRWQRHYLDSAQLLPLIPDRAETIMDLGSGGGFPGLLLALIHQLEEKKYPERHFFLVDSITKKCAFLREVAAHFQLKNVTVINKRIEEIREPEKVDLITARALAELCKLFTLSKPFLHKDSVCLFMKGEKAQEELTSAAAHWKMEAIPHQSITHEAATILEIRHLSRGSTL